MNVVGDALSNAQRDVADLPEELRAAAFPEVLRFYLFGPTQLQGLIGSEPAFEPQSVVSDSNSTIMNAIELPDSTLIKSKGTRKQQIAWAAVTIEQADHQPVTTDAIASAIREKLGVKPPAVSNIATIMQRDLVPGYFTRSREGRGYRYHATSSVSDLFSGLG